jgi:hypothetical protein
MHRCRRDGTNLNRDTKTMDVVEGEVNSLGTRTAFAGCSGAGQKYVDEVWKNGGRGAG